MEDPELIELMAKATYERFHIEGLVWEAVSPEWRKVWLDDARTALEVAGPVIAAQALRDVAEAFRENQTIREGDVKALLRARADEIEEAALDSARPESDDISRAEVLNFLHGGKPPEGAI